MTIDANKNAESKSNNIDSHRRKLLLATGGLAFSGGWPLGSSASAQSQAISLSTAINRSGYIRALSQQVAKAYTQIALGVLPEKGHNIIASSQALIQRNIQELRAVSNSKEAIQHLETLDAQAAVLLASVSHAASKAEALAVSVQSDIVLSVANRVTNFYQSLSKSAQAKIVNMAGRQRMLSQRTAKFYFLIQAGHDNKDIQNEMTVARTEFKSALDVMISLPISTPSIKSDLELAKQQWGALEVSLDSKANPIMMRNVATTSERMLDLMDSLTNQYDQALREMLG